MIPGPARLGPVALFLVWLAVCPAVGPALADQQPINDFAGVLSQSQRAELNDLAGLIRDKTGWRIMVAVIKSVGDKEAGASATDQIAGRYFTRWGLDRAGSKGCLVLMAMTERRIRFKVGPASEKVLTKDGLGRIRDQFMFPHFERGDYAAGLLNGMLALGQQAAAAENVSLGLDRRPQGASGRSRDWIAVIALTLLTWLAYGKLKARRRGPLKRDGLHSFGPLGGGFGPFGGGRIR